MLDNQIRPLNIFLHHVLEQLEQIDDYHYFANPVDETEVKINARIAEICNGFLFRFLRIINLLHIQWISPRLRRKSIEMNTRI